MHNRGPLMGDIERNLIIAVLKLTRCNPISHELINREAKIPSAIGQKLLKRLQNEGLIYVAKGTIRTDSFERLKLAVRALSLGADPENVSGVLQWQEFEGIAAVIFRENHYAVCRNLRFKHAGRRYEIDVVACKKPLAVCLDCKHWHRGYHPSTLKNVVREQVERTKALARCVQNSAIQVECSSWNEIMMIPAVLSLLGSGPRFLDDVPIIPVLQFQDFLNELPLHVTVLKHFSAVRRHF